MYGNERIIKDLLFLYFITIFLKDYLTIFQNKKRKMLVPRFRTN